MAIIEGGLVRWRDEWSRISWKRVGCVVQFFYPRAGPIAPRPISHGDYHVFVGRDSLDFFTRLDHPPLVHFGCSAL
jgi:hypothetical protein